MKHPVFACAAFAWFGLSLTGSCWAQEPSRPIGFEPNCLIEIQQTLASALGEQLVDQVEPVRDNILKTDIYGVSHSRGKVTVEFIPCQQQAMFDLVLVAQSSSRTVGYHGPVRVYNTAVGDLYGRKRVWIDAGGVCFAPAQACDRLYPTLECMSTRFKNPTLDRAITKAALKKYYKQDDLATRIAEDHAAVWIRQGFDRDADPQLLSANRDYQEKLRKPYEQRNIFPEQVVLQTTQNTMFIRLRLSEGAGAVALAAPPEPDAAAEGALRVHESMLNTGAARLFAGKTYLSVNVLKELSDLFSIPIPAEEIKKFEQDDIEIEFDKQRPFEYHFDDNIVQLTIRGTKYVAQDTEFPAMSIILRFRLERTAKGVRAAAVGDARVTALGKENSNERLTGPRLRFKSLLNSHLEDLLKKPQDLDEIALPPTLGKNVKLVPIQAQTSQGWLVIGIRRAE
ncbi:MAG TPA: hypothetical protein VKS79_18180 [Gemmataceae bacterium]|nr:hypothetical protein [Gemmataceae bacterium]